MTDPSPEYPAPPVMNQRTDAQDPCHHQKYRHLLACALAHLAQKNQSLHQIHCKK
jgi:hypothetical protein